MNIRDAFELWGEQRGLNLRHNERGEGYYYIPTQKYWECWQAATASVIELEPPSIKCVYCKADAIYEGWVRTFDPLGLPTGLMRLAQVCKDHAKHLIGYKE